MKIKQMLSIVLLVIKCFSMTIAAKAEGDILLKGNLYVNGQQIENSSTILIQDNEILMPLRSILEAMGSKVNWDEASGNIYFDYSNIKYVCKFLALNPNFPENKSIMICEVDKESSTKNKDYVQLNPMAANGVYTMIEDRTYLNQETGKRLFEALGCTVEFELDTKTVSIREVNACN